ncbi:hypothetical protein ACFL6Y_10205 [Elusimicrobiota bacterium]
MCKALQDRHGLGEGISDEDNIRYYFHTELMARKVSAHSVTLECSCLQGHPMRGIDMRVKLANKKAWLEFKFHRRLPGGTLAKTEKLGNIIADFLRLAYLPRGDQKYCCYIVDSAMFKYLNNGGYKDLICNKPFTVYRKKGEFYLGSTKLSPFTKKIIRKGTWKMPLDIRATAHPVPLEGLKAPGKNNNFPYQVFFYRIEK